MKLLITGGLGYLGGRLAQHLAASCSHEISIGTRQSIASVSWLPQVSILPISWQSSANLLEICKNIDAIIHVAGMNAQDCAKDPIAALECNAVYAGRLLQAAISQEVQRFIYVSTAHVYASPLVGKITEETCAKNLHPYATSHRAAEDIVLAAHHQKDIDGIVIRLSNSYGAPAHVEANCWMLLVNDLCRQAAQYQKIQLSSSGKQRRDFIALTDVCQAVQHLLRIPSDKLDNGLFNLGGSFSPTVLEMANLIAKRFQKATSHPLEFLINDQNKLDERNAEKLDYDISKLLNTGFQLSEKNTVEYEIDNLIQFCLEHYYR